MEIQKHQFISDVKRYAGIGHEIVCTLIELVSYDRQIITSEEQLHLMDCFRKSNQVNDPLTLAFMILDHDDDGYITKSQLCNFLSRFGYKYDPVDINNIFSQLNGKKLKINNHLSKDEFITFVSSYQ